MELLYKDDAFSKLSLLLSTELVQSAVMTETCEICDRTFTNKNSSRTHRSRFHGQNQDITPKNNDSYSNHEDTSQYEMSSDDSYKDTTHSLSDNEVSRKRRRRESGDSEGVNLFKIDDNSATLQNRLSEMLKHQELIQILVIALLDGQLPITPAQVKQLKVYRDIVRQYSEAPEEEREEILTDSSNRRCLRVLFETISYSINSIF